MPATSPEPAPVRRPEPHQVRQIAESFGVDPERYDRTRPRYPDALVERIVAASPGPVAASPGPKVVDVGCGTGIAGPAVPGGRGGHGAWGSSPTGGWLTSRGAGGVEAQTWRRSRAGHPRAAGYSTPSSPGQPGSGWTRSSGAAKAAQGAAARWPVGAFPPRVPGSARGDRKPSPDAYRRVAPDSPFDLRPADDVGPGRVPSSCSSRSPTGSGRRAGSASQSSGGSTGIAPTPGPSGWTSCPRTGRPHPARAGESGRSAAGGRRVRHRRAGVAASRCPTSRWLSPRREPGPPDRAFRTSGLGAGWSWSWCRNARSARRGCRCLPDDLQRVPGAGRYRALSAAGRKPRSPR